jgi:hypothetical protein
MLNQLRTLVLMAALTVLAAGAAAAPPDLTNGTWKLNVAESKFSPGPAPRSQTRTYKETDGTVALTFTQVSASGRETTGGSIYRYDGKDYAFTGSTLYDTIAVRIVDDHTVESMQKKSGMMIGTTTRTVSADGKRMTIAAKGISESGTPYENIQVFDRE